VNLGFRGRLVAVSLLFLVVGGLVGYLYLDARFSEIVMQTGVDASVRKAMHGALGRSALVGGAIAIGVALFMSYLASNLLSRQLRHLVVSARRALGEDTTDAPSDLASLRGSVSRLTGELERSVESIATERDRLRAILSGIGEGIVALDEKRRVEFANDTAEALLGRAAEGRALVELVRNPEVLALVETEDAGEVEVRRDGQTLLLKKSARRENGGFVLVLLDVTQQRRLMRMRQDFIANVSHELRTPVTVIRTNAEALADGALDHPERAPVFVERTLRHAERLSELIDDLLDLARVETGDQPLEPEPLELEPLIRGALNLVSSDAEVEVEVAVERVLADRDALERILVNLLGNALKHGGDRVRVAAGLEGGRVVISVEDDGPGIPERYRERIFERFFRVDKGRDRASGGTGLGLAIVKHLALAQGGRAGYRPADPHGSVFWVELPKAP
jgi:two-component system phosphate regulon sensor histidine kinase PhoR